MKKAISLFLFLFLTCRCSYAESAKYIRVAIIKDVSSLSLKVAGSYELIASSTHEVLLKGKNLRTTVTSFKKGILLGGMIFNLDKILFSTTTREPIIINGRKFRGGIQFIKNKNNRLTVVNYIELEDYIKGISVREVSHYWPIEVLKAEVIAFRTYAVYQIEENREKDYDVTADIYSQVYGGKAAERYRINKAVDETKGMILKFKGEVFPAFYHATCAGYTEEASALWNIDIACLKGVACGFCKDSPHFSWHYVLGSDEARGKLTKAGYRIAKIENIQIISRDKSGRINELKIIAQDRHLNLAAKDFRNIISPNLIKSTNFSVNVVKGDIVFEGFGWGHGVGLCQWGSYFMAKQGYNYKQILEYYYPGVEISQ
jgi:stage II sporulation protein D